MPQLLREGARTLSSLAPTIDAEADHAWALDDLKQVSFYTDCLGQRHWSSPEEVIDAHLANTIVARAEAVVAVRPMSERQLELWAEIVGPQYKKPGMKDAVLRWQAAMIKEGLSNATVEKLAAFMGGTPVGVASDSANGE